MGLGVVVIDLKQTDPFELAPTPLTALNLILTVVGVFHPRGMMASACCESQDALTIMSPRMTHCCHDL